MKTTLQWLHEHLLACPVKSNLGFDCPGCGFQRAFLDLLAGDLKGVWEHYPPLFPFLMMILLLVLAFRTKLRYRMQVLGLSIATTCSFIAINYAHKIF